MARPRTSTAPRVSRLGLGSRHLTLTHSLMDLTPGALPPAHWSGHHWKLSFLGPPCTPQGHRGQPGLAGGERRCPDPHPMDPACSLLASRGSSTVSSIGTPSVSWPPGAPGSCGGSDTGAARHLCVGILGEVAEATPEGERSLQNESAGREGSQPGVARELIIDAQLGHFPRIPRGICQP